MDSLVRGECEGTLLAVFFLSSAPGTKERRVARGGPSVLSDAGKGPSVLPSFGAAVRSSLCDAVELGTRTPLPADRHPCGARVYEPPRETAEGGTTETPGLEDSPLCWGPQSYLWDEGNIRTLAVREFLLAGKGTLYKILFNKEECAGMLAALKLR
ncbi:hypothetical protein SKAU_G00356340 [Synaphobranchus kaupii]|uniref:Uncharacterized protein n=1 Tax=Synaphobranchus kaupii TaxID=118154 RepID=A0A9Q1IEI0_SYNKA|nr:hypothetical protein SKAU_G00356340 [Synaphobranchus kaupii]